MLKNALSLPLAAAVFGAALGIYPRRTWAQAPPSFAGKQVVTLKNGANAVDIDGDGTPDLVFMGWSENYNAHSSYSVSFYLRVQGQQDTLSRWYDIPFIGDHDYAEGFKSEQGA